MADHTNSEDLFSLDDTVQNFSKITSLVDRKGMAIICKDQATHYVLIDYGLYHETSVASDVFVDLVTEEIMAKHVNAFKELAK
jgi:antitoxin Phd